MFINLGKKDRIRFDEMREFLFQQTRVSGHKIRDIDMQPTCSFFETDAGSAGKILSIKHPIQYKGRSVRISYADQDGQAPAPPSSGRAPRQGQYSSEKKSGKGPTYKAPQPRAQRRTQDETDW